MSTPFLNEHDPQTLAYYNALPANLRHNIKMSGLKFMSQDEIDLFINRLNTPK